MVNREKAGSSRRMRAAAVLLLATAGCSTSEQPAGQTGAEHTETDAPTCEGMRQAGCVSTEGVRYFLAGKHDANTAVVVDLGGPGLAIGATTVLKDFVAALPKSLVEEHRVIALDEPWTYLPATSEACEAAAGRWLRVGRESLSTSNRSLLQAASELREECSAEFENSGWSQQHYREAVAAALRNEDVQLQGFIGASFGAARRLYLDGEIQPDWTILVDPAPPNGTLIDLLQDRTFAAQHALTTACATCTDEHLAMAALSLDVTPMPIEGRSLPVTGADLLSAIAVGAKQPPPIQHALAQALRGPDASVETLATVGQTSDAAWGRYGTHSLAPSSFAYFAEVCAAYPGAPAAEQQTSIGRALGALHSPCIDGPSSGLPDPPIADLCIVTHTGDVVAGPATQRWTAAYPHAVSHPLAPGPHGSPDLVGCWKEPT